MMHRVLRYLLALCIAGGVTSGVATQHDSSVLLTGTFVTYATAIALSLRYPGVWRLKQPGGVGPDTASGVAAVSAVAGITLLMHGVGDRAHLGAGVMGLGLVLLGMSVGIRMVETGDVPLEQGDTDVPSGNSE